MVLLDKSIRCSFASYMTEDSAASSAIATPIDASPQLRPLNPPSDIINIINDDPFPNVRTYPVARRSVQTSPQTPVPTPAQVFAETAVQTSDVTPSASESTFKINKLWPKLKHIVSKPTSHEDGVKKMLDSLHIQKKPDHKRKNEPQQKRWLGRNKSRVGPQI